MSADVTTRANKRPHALTPSRPTLPTLALFLAFLGFYLLTASGHLYAVDEETLFRITEGIVERHSVALPNDAWGMVGNRSGPDGPLYAQYTPGQPLAAVPLYLAGKTLATRFPPEASVYILRFCVSLLGAFVTAATVALLYRLARRLDYGGGAALTLAAIYGLATTAWPHGRTFFAEPLTALCALAAFAAIRRGTTGGMPHWLLPAGIAAAASVAVKPQTVLIMPGLGLYLLLAAFDRAGIPPSLPAPAQKLAAALDVVEREGRRLVWTDDDAIPLAGPGLDRLTVRPARTLLVRPAPLRGLQPDHLDVIEAFLAG